MKNSAFKKLVAVGILLTSMSILSGCTKDPSSSFHDREELGYFEGMKITFVGDDSPSNGKGFYVLDDTKSNNNKETSQDFSNVKMIGHYGDKTDIYFVQDKSSSVGKGFYVFKDKDGQIIPSLTLSAAFSSGKSQTQKSVGVLYQSSLERPSQSLPTTLQTTTINGDEVVLNVKKMSTSELLDVSAQLRKIAEVKLLQQQELSQTISSSFRP